MMVDQYMKGIILHYSTVCYIVCYKNKIRRYDVLYYNTVQCKTIARSIV